jgi:TonB family protein
MRFYWFPATSHGTSLTPGALLSVATHAVFLGAVAYSSGPHSDLLQFREPQSQLYYLPPPDRVAGRAALVEQLQYVELGAGAPTSGSSLPDAHRPGEPLVKRERSHGGIVAGKQPVTESAEAPVASSDSVYSVLSLEESARRVEGSAAPIYPSEMLAQGIEGVVRTRYVIDTTGRADSASLQVLAASNVAFEVAVRAAVPGMRFFAASVQQRKVRQVVEQEFQFHIAAAIPPAPVSAPAEHTRTRPAP